MLYGDMHAVVIDDNKLPYWQNGDSGSVNIIAIIELTSGRLRALTFLNFCSCSIKFIEQTTALAISLFTIFLLLKMLTLIISRF